MNSTLLHCLFEFRYNFEPDYADSMFNFNLSVKIYRSIE